VGLLEPNGRGRRPFRRDALSGTAAPPVFTIHSLVHAIAALTAAAEAARSVVFLSAPDAGIYAGPGWFKALIDGARGAVPAALSSAILDCGDDAGAAQGAIRAGIEGVVFIGRTDVAERLTAIAEQRGARLLTTRPATQLDLGSWFFADGETLRRICADRLASLRPIC
jgi:hypothetical protein